MGGNPNSKGEGDSRDSKGSGHFLKKRNERLGYELGRERRGEKERAEWEKREAGPRSQRTS